MRSQTTRRLVVAATTLLVAGCGSTGATFTPQPSAHPDAVLMVRTSGPGTASKKLTEEISDHVITVDCTGKGHITFKALLGDAHMESTVTCPSVTTAPAVNVDAKKTVKLEITAADGDVDGFVELAPKED